MIDDNIHTKTIEILNTALNKIPDNNKHQELGFTYEEIVYQQIGKYLENIKKLFNSYNKLALPSDGNQRLTFGLIFRPLWEISMKIIFISLYLHYEKYSEKAILNSYKLIHYDECIYLAKTYIYTKNNNYKDVFITNISGVFSSLIDLEEFSHDKSRRNLLDKLSKGEDSEFIELAREFDGVESRISYIDKYDEEIVSSKGEKYKSSKIDLMIYNLCSGAEHGSIQAIADLEIILSRKEIDKRLFCHTSYSAAIEVIRIYSKDDNLVENELQILNNLMGSKK